MKPDPQIFLFQESRIRLTSVMEKQTLLLLSRSQIFQYVHTFLYYEAPWAACEVPSHAHTPPPPILPPPTSHLKAEVFCQLGVSGYGCSAPSSDRGGASRMPWAHGTGSRVTGSPAQEPLQCRAAVGEEAGDQLKAAQPHGHPLLLQEEKEGFVFTAGRFVSPRL